MKQAVEITVLSGEFDSQPLVFSYLLSWAPMLDLDLVEVICNMDPTSRLRHYLPEKAVAEIEDLAGLDTTVVMLLGPRLQTNERLRCLGAWAGVRHVPG